MSVSNVDQTFVLSSPLLLLTWTTLAGVASADVLGLQWCRQASTASPGLAGMQLPPERPPANRCRPSADDSYSFVSYILSSVRTGKSHHDHMLCAVNSCNLTSSKP